MRPDQQHSASRREERLARLRQCRAEIQDILAEYCDIQVEVEDDSYTASLPIVLTDGYETINFHEE